MVKQIVTSASVSILLIAALSSNLRADDPREFHQLEKYRKWAFVAGPSLYNRAAISPRYGDYTFTNKPIPSYCFGVMYTFHPEQKWSFSTGLLVNNEPVYRISIKIKKSDLYPHYREDYESEEWMYAIYTFSFPLWLEYNVHLRKKTNLILSTGLKAMFFPYGSADMVTRIFNEEHNESREIFGLKLNSQDFFFYGSYTAGFGVSHMTGWSLLKVNVIYVVNFQNTFEGEYQFANLLSSPDSRGYYKLSGNYIGLLFSVNLKKKESKIGTVQTKGLIKHRLTNY